MEKPLGIKIENKFQYLALKEYYKSKNWKNYNDLSCTEKDFFPCTFQLKDNYRLHLNESYYTMLSFAQFSQLTGIKATEEIELHLSGLPTIKINTNGVTIGIQDESYLGSCLHLDILDIEAIITAYKSF